MRSGHVLAGSLAFASRAMADIYFSAPVGGDTYAAGAAITVTMVDNGENPSVADLSSYDLSICYGGDTTGTYVCLVQYDHDNIIAYMLSRTLMTISLHPRCLERHEKTVR